MKNDTTSRVLSSRIIGSRIAFLLAALSWVGCSAPPLRVGSDLEHAPFIDTDPAGVPRGRDIDLIERMARQIGREVVWVRLPFEEVLPALERGEIDVACATLGITPERAARVDFLSPNYVTNQLAVVRVGSAEPSTLQDLAGQPVAASRGTTSERALSEAVPAAHAVLENERALSPRERLLSGAVAAVILDGPDALALVTANPGVLRVLPDALAEERYAFAVNRTSPALRAALEGAQEALRRAGVLAEIDRRYGIDPIE